MRTHFSIAAALVQEGAASSRSLESQADGMRELVSRFKIDEAAAPHVSVRPRLPALPARRR